MPVIIPVGEEERWLSDSLSKDEINAFLKPYDAGKMDAYVIVRNFFKMDSHDKHIIDKYL